MRGMLRFTSIALFFLISACSMLQPQGDALEQKVNKLVEEKRYEEAQKLLANIPRDSADFTRFAPRRKQVDALAAQYERKVVDDARQLMMQERWAQALDLYDQALDRMPNSKKLQDGQADLRRLQQQRVARQESELLIIRAEKLVSALPTYQNLAQLDPRDKRRVRDYQDKKEEAAALARELIAAADKALLLGDYEQAERLVSLAAQLSNAPEIRQAQQRLEQARIKRNREARSQREEAQRDQGRSETVAQLQRDYDSAMQQRNYLTARSLLMRLRTYAPELVMQNGYERELNNQIAIEAERLYSEGVTFYGHSEFEKARDNWQMVLQLVPNHAKAKESLGRVNKVLKKIEHLRKKQKHD